MPDAIAAGEDKLESEENLLEKQEEDLSEQSLLEVSKIETKKNRELTLPHAGKWCDPFGTQAHCSEQSEEGHEFPRGYQDAV